MTAEETERDVLQRLSTEFEADGYEVFLHPNRPLLPEFIGNYVPDLIARRSGGNIAVEITRRNAASERKIQSIAKLFENQRDWEFRVVWITPTLDDKALQLQTPEQVKQRLSEVRELASAGHYAPSFLLAWATFEALGRLAAPAQFGRPQTPGRLIQVLATEGYLTPTEADLLRPLSGKRNRLIHGELNTPVSKEDVMNFIDVLDELLNLD